MTDKMRLRRLTDIVLLILFIITLLSGIKMHVTDYVTEHDWWRIWDLTHTTAGLMMLLVIIMHVYQHSAWYRALVKPAKAHRLRIRRITVLSLTTLFTIVIVTGLWILFAPHYNHHIGKAHFIIGLTASLFAVGHIITRRKFILNHTIR